jgi:hypothetical protein
MHEADTAFPGEGEDEEPWAAPPGVLLDLLGVSAVVLDRSGRIVFWSPQADDVFGYTAQEALGQYAVRLLVHKEHRYRVMRWFSEIRDAGASPTAPASASTSKSSNATESGCCGGPARPAVPPTRAPSPSPGPSIGRAR